MKAILLIIVSLLLIGCQNNKEINENEHHESNTEVVSESSNEVDNEKEQNSEDNSLNDGEDKEENMELWNDNKSEQLDEFIHRWEQDMGQEYTQYAPGKNADLYGVKIPDGILKGDNIQMQPVLGQPEYNETVSPLDLEWSKDGQSEADYAVVAVYSDDTQVNQNGPHHVYLFVLRNGEPNILYTEQNQGNENNYLYFWPTENQELMEGFVNIVNG